MVDLALEDLTRALELDAENYMPYYNRGNLRVARGELSLALQIPHEEAIAKLSGAGIDPSTLERFFADESSTE